MVLELVAEPEKHIANNGMLDLVLKKTILINEIIFPFSNIFRAVNYAQK